MRTTQEFQDRVGRIESLIAKLKSAADPALRGAAAELVQTLMELHGAGIERMIGILATSGNGPAVLSEFATDPMLSSLLLLYDLHPHPFEERVLRGLELARPALRSEGAHAELLEIEDGAIRVKLVGAPPAVASQLELALRNALWETAPDATEVTVEGILAAKGAFVPLTAILSANGSPAALAAAGKP